MVKLKTEPDKQVTEDQMWNILVSLPLIYWIVGQILTTLILTFHSNQNQ
jgi:hypothetical protein